MNVQYLKYLLGNLLLMAGILAILIGGPSIWLVAIVILAIGGPVDEAVGDQDSPLSDLQRRFFEINLYATLPLLVLMSLAMLWMVATDFQTGLAADLAKPSDLSSWAAAWLPHWLLPGWPFGPMVEIAGAVFLVGYCYAVFGATVGHELTHRTGIRAAYMSARGLFAPTFNTAFTTFHVHGHHRKVATFSDPATARRGEYILLFLVRTVWGQLIEALRFEAARARRAGDHPYGLSNRAVTGQFYSVAAVAGAGLVAGWPGIVAFVCAGLIGRFFHELVNYVQHFGLVRIEGAPVEQRHTWDCRRLLSNVMHYNLPLHADHHMFASKSFWQLQRATDAPVLPHGYQTMATIALVPPLWRRTMAPLLAEWDARFASDAERDVVRARGWDLA